uniref:Uncharacterized protein n=1 Tax=Rhizophora mucronata TaxID=61149 RepID=A0A2P2NT91_RHIMU
MARFIRKDETRDAYQQSVFLVYSK